MSTMRGFGIARKCFLSKRFSADYKCVVGASESSSFHTSTVAAADSNTLFVTAGESYSAYYAKHRLSYTAPVFEAIIKFYKEKLNDFGLAVDVGCGPGQGTVPLASYFKKVVGLDVSEQQVKQAPRDIPNLSFDVSPAEDLSRFDCRSVDLITVAEAVHWFDLDRFYKEVGRVLKPGGSFVVYGYGIPSLCLPAADEYIKDMAQTVVRDWPKELSILLNDYMDMAPPFPLCRSENIALEKDWTIKELVQFAGSCCPPNYFETSQREDVEHEFENNLKSLYQSNGERRIKVTFSVFMNMSHKPDN